MMRVCSLHKKYRSVFLEKREKNGAGEIIVFLQRASYLLADGSTVLSANPRGTRDPFRRTRGELAIFFIHLVLFCFKLLFSSGTDEGLRSPATAALGGKRSRAPY